jgi:hypothetical protein
MVLGNLGGQGPLFEGHDAKTLALDSAEYLSDEASGDTIGLDQDKGALGHEYLLGMLGHRTGMQPDLTFAE